MREKTVAGTTFLDDDRVGRLSPSLSDRPGRARSTARGGPLTTESLSTESPFRVRRRVEFRDTDAAGIVHFSSFVLYMEQAEHEFLRQLGLSVQMAEDDGKISWPRVSVRCDFRGMLRFEDWFEVAVRIVRLGEKSVTYGFQFFHADQLVAEGDMTSVCCRFRPGRPPESIRIPEPIRARLAAACPGTSNA